MDCVICSKCRVWGKLQILGFATAIKVLLTDEVELDPSNGLDFAEHPVLRRQEVIALVNVLNQFSKSIEFASRVHAQGRPVNVDLNEPSFLEKEIIKDNFHRDIIKK